MRLKELVGCEGGGGRHEKKKGFRGGPSQKRKGKEEDHVKRLSKTLKWHNALISEMLKFKRQKGAEETAKESREAKDKSYEDYP